MYFELFNYNSCNSYKFKVFEKRNVVIFFIVMIMYLIRNDLINLQFKDMVFYGWKVIVI